MCMLRKGEDAIGFIYLLWCMAGLFAKIIISPANVGIGVINTDHSIIAMELNNF